jgi:hypothetical protein
MRGEGHYASIVATKLQTELETYARERAGLLAKAKDQFVLIKGEEVVGTFFSYEDALKRGYERFGAEPFFVKQIVDVDVPVNFASRNVAI